MMDLGEKLRQARIEAGLSQRQLCGEEITRNMLSQIEHGTAKPSMKTLAYLAERLGKPISFFLEESVVVSPNTAVMQALRAAVDVGDFAGAEQAIADYTPGDPVYDREERYLAARVRLALAAQALEENRALYALELLENVPEGEFPELGRRKWLLEAKAPGVDLAKICEKLGSMDEELTLRAEAALENGNPERCGQLLDAVEERTEAWKLLRGRAYRMQGEYEKAAVCLLDAQDAYPAETAENLEICYRELGNYERAYFYACKRR